jgi:hypothetical protein
MNDDGISLVSMEHTGTKEYAFAKMNAVVDAIDYMAETVVHRAFVKHLRRIADAVYVMEMTFVGTYVKGDSDEAIQSCLPQTAVLEQAISEAKTAKEDVAIALELAKKKLAEIESKRNR